MAATRSQAASAVRPLVSTVVRCEGGCMGGSLVRSEYRRTETPQAFLTDTLMGGYAR